MNKSDLLRSLKSLFLVTIPKVLFLYVLVPLLILVFLKQPVADAALASDTEAFRIHAKDLMQIIFGQPAE